MVELDMVDDMEVDKVADMVTDKKRLTSTSTSTSTWKFGERVGHSGWLIGPKLF